MPIITAIFDSKINPSLFAVYSDDKFLADLSLTSIEKFSLKIGLNITSSTTDELRQASVIDVFFLKSLKLVSVRKRSKKEIKDYLSKNQLSADLADEVIEKLVQKGYLNDEEFARSFINDRMLLNPVSYLKLTYLLKAKGISQEIISSIISKNEINNQALARIVEKKRKLSRFKDDKKLINYLISQGFAYSDIKDYLDQD